MDPKSWIVIAWLLMPGMQPEAVVGRMPDGFATQVACVQYAKGVLVRFQRELGEPPKPTLGAVCVQRSAVLGVVPPIVPGNVR